ncbi:ABC transporter permease [Arcanobacterium pinnipediorum]|uniref:Oligopeptide transport system permease protein OppC n=1 Tax=Arcanobacterium pinnipediorum TaxID=1503041 RepID=A0ABY5AG30_9ACTO|nr:ABC transporter permease [Arcanobacterium pinnipediorum]USR79143.1 ABC transporter permease [Arcanobacterium pinnipediorum]
MVTQAEIDAVQAQLTKDADIRMENAVRYSRGQLIRRRFLRNKTAVFGVFMLIGVVALALFGSYISQWDYLTRDRTAPLQGPSGNHWFGTDNRGRDIFALTIEGLRTSLMIGFSVAFLQTSWAALFGSSIAYFGRWIDKVGSWIIDLMLVIPSFLLIAVINQRLSGQSSSVVVLIILLALFGWMLTARVVRSLTMSVKSLDYVHAAQYMSVPPFFVIIRHIIPNISSLLIIDFTLGIAGAVLSETTLSYFGLGIKDPQISLGALIGQGQASALTHSWLFVPPALVLVFMLVSVNFIGDGLRDAIDPTSKSGGKA